MKNSDIVNNEAKNWSKPLVFKDRYRIWTCFKEVSKLRAESLIDVGCGDGDFIKTVFSNKTLKNITCSDLSTLRIKNTLKKFKKDKRLNFRSADITNLPFNSREFETVVSFQVLEHIKNYKKAVSQLAKISSRYLVVSVPYKEKVLLETCLHCNKKTPRFGHIHSFSGDEISRVIKKDFKLVKSKKIYSKTFKYFSWLEGLGFTMFSVVDFIFSKIFKNSTWVILIYERKK